MTKYLILFLFTGFTAMAQYEPMQQWNYKADASLRYNYIQAVYRVTVQPGFIFSHGKSNIRLAPIFQLQSTEAVNDPYRFKFTGVSGIYRLQVPSARKFTELFFQYEGTFQIFRNTWGPHVWVPSLNTWQPYQYKSREIYSSHTVGYGVILNWKQFYIYNVVAAGIYFSTVDGEPVSEGAPDVPRYDFRGYDGYGLNYAITTGLGYKFPVKDKNK